MRTGFLLTCGALALLGSIRGRIEMDCARGLAGTAWRRADARGDLQGAPRSRRFSRRGLCRLFFWTGTGWHRGSQHRSLEGDSSAPPGKPAQGAVAKKTVHNLKVTTLDVSGDYSGMGGPMSKGKPVPGYRLLGAIIEGPRDNNLFVKFTGPAKTVAANQAKFEALLASFDKQ
jgi:hypothetical protein